MDYLSIITENENKIAKIILSDTNLEVKKIIIRPVGIKGKKVFLVEKLFYPYHVVPYGWHYRRE